MLVYSIQLELFELSEILIEHIYTKHNILLDKDYGNVETID